MEKTILVNGNNKPYQVSVPKLEILTDVINDVALKHIEENTGLKFVKIGSNCYSTQPQNFKQIALLLLTYDFKTQYQDNATIKNTILLKFSSPAGFRVDNICYHCLKRNHINTSGLNEKDILVI